jgi:predicted CXXCH cytochrome family protein
MMGNHLQAAFLSLAVVSLLSVTATADGVKGAVAADFAAVPPAHALRLPTAVAIGPGDDVFVLDGVNNRVVVFDANGQPTALIVPSGDATLQQPVGLRTTPDGRVWIADSGNGRLIVCTSAGVVEQTIAIPPAPDGTRADPTDVAISPDGATLWVADNDNHRVLRYDVASAAWTACGEDWQYPFQLCVSPAGELLVSDVINARVQVLGPNGAVRRSVGTYGVELGQVYRPGGLAVDRDGNIWVADSVIGVVQIFRPDGAILDVLRDESDRPLRFESPLGLAFDRHGALYVVESLAGRVRKVQLAKVARPAAAPQVWQPGAGQQSQSCTVCHFEWTPPFAEGRDSSLIARPVSTRDDPVASRGEMCLSCHNGTVADSRLRVWDAHGHRTGVAPPAGMRIPAHLPLLEGKLACRTCHAAHGSDVSQADIRRAVMLRGPNQAGELCSSCHVDKTRGPRFGTHPTSGLPWAIPAELVEAGAKVGPNPRELTCQACHAPHGARNDRLLVMSASSNQLCLTCHERIRPGMFRDGSHTEHPLTATVNAAQTQAVRELGTRLGPEGQLVCLSCHKLHHGKGGRFLLADDLSEGQMCLRCHESRRSMLGTSHDLRTNFPAERNRLGMSVSDGGACSSCHLFHRYAREQTPGAGDAAGQCLTCHRDGGCAENKRLGSANHPSLRCTECHDPHQSQFGSFLRQAPTDLCASCHSDKTRMFGGPHDPSVAAGNACDSRDTSRDRCLSCHRPHGDAAHGLFRVAPIASHAGTSGACLACHTNVTSGGSLALLHTQSASPQAASSGLPLVNNAGGSQEIGCGTCHDPHGGPTHDALLRTTSSAGGVELCVRCHTDMSQIVVTAHSPEAMRQHGLGSAACGPCHQVHGDARNVSQHLLWPNGLLHADAVAGDQYCLACHRDGGAAAPPAIASHPDVQMFDATAATVAALPLFDASGKPDPHGRIGCRTCHLPHGRPMPEVPITATRTPEFRAQRVQLRAFEPPNACTSCHSVDALRRFLYFHDRERRGGVTELR